MGCSSISSREYIEGHPEGAREHIQQVIGLAEECSCDSCFMKINFIPAIDPCMLMTVNNLAAPVEKTAAQSMKVTYTITET